MLVVPHLGTAGGIGGVGSVAGEFAKHRGDEEVDADIVLNEVLKFLDDWVEVVGFFVVDVGDYAAKPLVVGVKGRGHPFSDAEREGVSFSLNAVAEIAY